MYRLGIDIGSKTAKMVLLDEKDRLVFSQYTLHKSNVLGTFSELLGNTIWRFGNHEVELCVTGSSGMRFAQDLGLAYVQEVIASRRALQCYLPEVDVAIELGGEDAKILFLRDTVEERMNGSCAGGTGGFLDLMCGMLSVRAKQFNALAAAHMHLYPIASRCAVFAQADVRPLINAGARKSDIAASVMQAIVTQTITGLACGRTIEGKVAFLGGPCEVYSELVQRFRKTLGLSHAQTYKPENAHLFVASGAALSAGDRASHVGGSILSLEELKARIDALPQEQDGSFGRLPALFANDGELAAFKARHEQDRVPRSRLMDYEGDIFVGIDAGSTTLKLAAIDATGKLLYSAYENNQGDVVETMRETLDEFYRASPREYGGQSLTTVRRSLVCGYGEDLLKTAFCLDSSEVETVAHLRAAQEFCEDASFVLDIGGQDIKCLRLGGGQIEDIMLNEACSSGCGALIQGFARSLGHTKWTFAEEALRAEGPVDLGTRCTVFMTSRVRQAQKEGASTADISAGLAYSVVRNALYKVMGVSNLNQFGERVVVQGGTFMNDAVLRAFELESDLEVVRPDIAHLMGAYGAALLARDEYLEQLAAADATQRSTILEPYELATLKQTQSTLRCEACTNACNLAVSSFYLADEGKSKPLPSELLLQKESSGGQNARDEEEERARQNGQQSSVENRVFVSGNRCERGARWAAGKLNQRAAEHTQGLRAQQADNLMACEQELLARSAARLHHHEGSPLLALPPVLGVYEHLVYWQTLFSELGFSVLPPQQSSGELYRLGAASVLSETVCYPAKLMHGHIAQGIARGAQFFFVPTFEREHTEDSKIEDGTETAGTGLLSHVPQWDKAAPSPLSHPLSPSRSHRNCPVVCGYGHLAVHDVQAFSGGRATLLSTTLAGPLPSTADVRELLRQAGREASDEAIAAACAAASVAEQHSFEQLWQKAEASLEQLDEGCRPGIVLLAHPYHSDPGINHTVDRLLAAMGYTVFSTASLERAALAWPKGEEGRGGCPTHPSGAEQPHPLCSAQHAAASTDDAGLPAEGWTQALRLYRVAEFVAAHPRLHAVQLHSFGCGVDALTVPVIQQIIQAAGKPYTAIKLDEMVDPATLRIRLRSLDYALSRGERKRTYGERMKLGDETVIFRSTEEQSCPVPLQQDAKAVPLQASPLSTQEPPTTSCAALPSVSPLDTEQGLASLHNDLCYQMLALGGQVLNWMQAHEGDGSFTLPTLCKNCRGAELERVLNQVLPAGRRVSLVTDTGAAEAKLGQRGRGCCPTRPSGTEQPRPRCPSFASAMSAPSSASALQTTQPAAPRIGVLGNAAMLLTPEFNDLLLQRIEDEGAVPVLPSADAVFASEQPLPELLPALYAQGIRDYIFVQSFGCLRSHVDARGALPELKADYPDCNITFLEYDPGISQVNQLSRLKLAVTIAFERN
ncbi:MAG: acyl-CoA dehydratase activase-related protein [Coriobacteriales bacterium]|jgi:activator of 2-hydroxyglutaryl-CoA dehydratase/predicted nucleotide-binding protein (sugar kinase/HSP70/actin superfamily)|nr:acyl-CoA dehydratase activase-related protein [Coriobacteriales bacterium]